MAGLFPMISPFKRSFGIHQDIGDVLDVAHFPFPASDFQQWIVRCRLRVGRVEQQHAAMPSTEARSQVPVLALDIMDNATARPSQKGWHHQTDTLAGSGRRKA